MKLRLVFSVVLVVAALLLFLRAGSVPLLDPDESRFARTSVEMLESGDLVVPRFGGEPRLVKPPLVHWIQSFFFSWFGPTEWAARLHAALATLGSILLVAWVGRLRFGEEGGIWAAAILATMPLVLVPGRLGTLDALLAVHVLAVIALDMAAPREGDLFRSFAVGALLGLAFLIKGPVGVVLPLLVILAGRTAARRNVLPSAVGVLQAAAAWCLVVLPWGLVFLRRVGPGNAIGLLRTEAFERYFAGTAHVEPPWYYLKIVAVAFLPWLAPLLVALVRTWQMRRTAAARTALYASAGLLAGLVFFSIGQTKLPNYILPLAPLAAILITWELGREIESPDQRTLGPTLLAATLAAAAVLLGLAAGLQLDGVPRAVALAGCAIYGAGALVAGYGAIRRRPRQVYGSAGATAAAFLLVVVVVLLPNIGQRKSAAPLIEAVPELSSGRPLVTVEIRVPSLTFYLNRAPEVLEMAGFEGRLAIDDDPLFVLADVDLPSVPEGAMAGLREIGRQGKFIVFEKKR